MFHALVPFVAIAGAGSFASWQLVKANAVIIALVVEILTFIVATITLVVQL